MREKRNTLWMLPHRMRHQSCVRSRDTSHLYNGMPQFCPHFSVNGSTLNTFSAGQPPLQSRSKIARLPQTSELYRFTPNGMSPIKYTCFFEAKSLILPHWSNAIHCMYAQNKIRSAYASRSLAGKDKNHVHACFGFCRSSGHSSHVGQLW